MLRLLKQWLSGEQGQAMAIVLALLAIGGLTIAVSLNYATTSLNGSRIVEEKMDGVYAAGAGVEYALWSLGSNGTPAAQLPQNINQMAVGIEPLDMGTFTLVRGELTEVSETAHPEWVDVDGGMVPDGARYRYTITVTWNATGNKQINLLEIGASLPPGFVYDGSPSIASENASPQDNISFNFSTFSQSTDNQSLWWTWFPAGQAPTIHKDNKTLWLRFYLTGTGNENDDYTWIKALSQDIGTVGEIIGTRYKITATARRPEDGKTTAEIVADVIRKSDGTISIASWLITK